MLRAASEPVLDALLERIEQERDKLYRDAMRQLPVLPRVFVVYAQPWPRLIE